MTARKEGASAMARLQVGEQIQGAFPVAGARQPMEVAQGRADIAVAHEPLQAFDRQPRGQWVSGIGMPQRVYSADFGHASRALGQRIGPLQPNAIKLAPTY